jgi:hypothetical protein
MKCRREISINYPSLRTFRNNLRKILWLEWDGRSRGIIRAQSDLLDVKPFQEEEFDRLQAKLGENRTIMKSSIVMCGWCHHRDKDAIYNPSNRQWFCPNCYNEHKEDILSTESFIY